MDFALTQDQRLMQESEEMEYEDSFLAERGLE